MGHVLVTGGAGFIGSHVSLFRARKFEHVCRKAFGHIEVEKHFPVAWRD